MTTNKVERLENAKKLMIEWSKKTGKTIKLSPCNAIELFEFVADLVEEKSENNKSLASIINKSSESDFKIAISDSFCTYLYDLPIDNNYSIAKVAKKIFKKFKIEETDGKLIV